MSRLTLPVVQASATHELDPPDIDQRVAAHCSRYDADVDWWLDMATMVASHPLARMFYIAHVAQEPSLEKLGDNSDESNELQRAMKDWGYRVAVEYVGARGSGQRRRSLVESYRVDWGHAAARDGMALSLWSHRANEIPGLGVRAAQFRCGKQAFQRVRDAVESRTTDLRGEFRHWLLCAKGEVSDGDYRDRWEAVTGKAWPRD